MTPRKATVRSAVEGEFKKLRKVAPELADSAFAAMALVLAGELDSTRNSATAKSMCARALSEVLDRMSELAPPAEEKDRLDELSKRRNRRRATA